MQNDKQPLKKSGYWKPYTKTAASNYKPFPSTDKKWSTGVATKGEDFHTALEELQATLEDLIDAVEDMQDRMDALEDLDTEGMIRSIIIYFKCNKYLYCISYLGGDTEPYSDEEEEEDTLEDLSHKE